MKNNYFFSVIIPYFNAEDIFVHCLSALHAQVCDDSFEVIVVDDGSDKDRVAKAPADFLYPLEIVHTEHRGQSAATNIGIQRARGEYVLLFAQDMIADSRLIAEHIRVHKKYNQDNYAVLGYMPFHPQIPQSVFTDFLLSGAQFAFTGLEDGARVDPAKYFYAPNVSLKRSYLLENGLFDETLPYGFQDLELGYRLGKKGLCLLFNKQALAYHYHPMDLESFCQKQVVMGKSLAQWHRKSPEVVNTDQSVFLKALYKNPSLCEISEILIRQIAESGTVDKEVFFAFIQEVSKTSGTVLSALGNVAAKILAVMERRPRALKEESAFYSVLCQIVYRIVTSSYLAQGYFSG